MYSRDVFICNTCVCRPGLKKILKVCGQVPELPDQLPLTENTQLIASVLLNKLYDDLKCDPERNNFRDICDDYIKYVYRIDLKFLWRWSGDMANLSIVFTLFSIKSQN